jgi:CheY-like chemotaxis protein
MQRILVVDDSEDMREVIKANLSPRYEVVDTGSPENAVALALEHRPDAILLDLTMPGLSGFELCRALSSLAFTQQIPIFIISGEDERNRTFCQNLGARGYFSKPIDFDDLKLKLSNIITPQNEERRANARIPLRLMLKLRGKNRNGEYFETRAATENVSKSGFLCTCNPPLYDDDVTLAVSLCGERELDLGYAHLVRVVTTDAMHPRYGFQFVGNSGAEVIKQI